MSRRRVDMLAASRKPVGRQGIWDAIRAQREKFDVGTICGATDIPRKTVSDYLHGLLRAGYVTFGEPTPDRNLGWLVLARDTGVEAPRVTKYGEPVTQGAAREQMWRAMKMLRSDWNFHDLAVAASLDDSPVDASDAKDYARNLAMAGYLAIVAKGGPRKPARYRFIQQKNTGPKPPMVQRMQTVFDPNLGKIVWHPQVES